MLRNRDLRICVWKYPLNPSSRRVQAVHEPWSDSFNRGNPGRASLQAVEESASMKRQSDYRIILSSFQYARRSIAIQGRHCFDFRRLFTSGSSV